MPWDVKDIMNRREDFVREAATQALAFSELCRKYTITRQTGYKWLARHRAEGIKGLADRSRRPHHSPKRSAQTIEARVLEMRQAHGWGGRKIAQRLRDLGETQIPAPATITEILRRHGLIDEQASRQRRHWQRFEHEYPNSLWQMDFKGDFPTLESGRCAPLTVIDDHSRYNVVLSACSRTTTQVVQEALERAFRCYGLPSCINTDNGAPWGSPSAPGQLTELAVWLIRLGIHVSYSRPYHPQTNGKDERFHRSLKAEVLQRHAFTTHEHVQRELDRWRQVYNTERPHEALGMAVPLTRYACSLRRMPGRLPEPEYRCGDEVLRVNSSGVVRVRGEKLKLSIALKGLQVAARPSEDEDGVIDIWFAHQRVAKLDLKAAKP
ncbi:IS481 family transposase [Paraburkholderia caribensis]|uniref:IS481 family transposase n=1 Tax=Paraburkholderia caribensis TaxID=75105 RepID=UPI00286467C0|nr:IS481 family transposase [Paraburkholderia caribensis]MDR6387405.1 transposase InsO family protein [Paraburkholderia caribensis]